ncbi:peptide MFS transporter [Methanobacterium sp. BAmetb5]|uniref:peptide MFS transporter n=1 Tax=Methanobacterium sp. BAmetb5 TaxID=2025351 RepID=UPI000E81A6CB|nr:peptide MFS transporter [Methanobacterium sp. BAmetb5]AXV39128.1 MAG: MFS transporter [Methanobacterium sp. BAmetb5]
MWERFSYYGMRAILSLYMIESLFYSKAFTSTIYGYYTGLVYLTPLLGGYVADRFWGNRRSIVTGGILMALGQFSLAFSSYLYMPTSINVPHSFFTLNTQSLFFILGLSLLVLGNGFFKPNISSMVGFLYSKNDERRDSAFTLFYMGINLGALISPLIIGALGDTGNPGDFMYGFLAAGTGMLIGLIIFILGKNRYLVTPTGKSVGSKPELYCEDKKSVTGPLTTIEKHQISVIFILAFFVIFFWASFEQAGVSLTFFADQNVDRVISALNNFTIPTPWFQSINPLLILLTAPLIAALWPKLRHKGLEPSIPLKMSIGLILLAFGFIILLPAAQMVDGGSTVVSPLYLVGVYFMMTLGELCISPIGLSMVSKLSPARFACLLMGVWFLSTAASNLIAGLLSTLYPDPAKPVPLLLGIPIDGFTSFFMIFIVLSITSAIILLGLSKRITKMMHGVQ